MARTKKQETYIYEWSLGNKNYVYYRYGIPYICNDGVVCMTSVKEGKFKYLGNWIEAGENVLAILKSKKPNATFYDSYVYEDLVKKLNK